MRSESGPAPAAPTADVCLVVATTESYLPGALVTVGSFLQHHPRFAGDIVVIHEGLCGTSRGALAALSDRLRFEPVGAALRERLACLAADFTVPRRAQLHSLDAFRLSGYRKVLLCDVDVLFRGAIDELLDSEADLLCSGDGAHLRGGVAIPSPLPRPPPPAPWSGPSPADSW